MTNKSYRVAFISADLYCSFVYINLAIWLLENAIQKTTLLLNGWPRTIAETMATATKFMKFSCLFCFRYNSSLTNSTQFGNDSNYSKFNGENIANNYFTVTVLALDGLTKKHFDHYALLKIFSLRLPRRPSSQLFLRLVDNQTTEIKDNFNLFFALR